jgi:hypothetical protein
MLRPAACASCAAALIAGSLAAAEPYQVDGGCRHQGGKTVVRTKSARVFTRNHVRFQNYFGTAAFGCASRSAQRVFLVEDEDPFYLSHWALAGKYVAYQYDECPAGCSQELDVVNLRTAGIWRRSATTWSELVSSHDLTFGVSVYTLALNARGSIVWTAGHCDVDAEPCPAGQLTVEVLSDGHLGRQRLDAGHDVVPGSLLLRGAVATWTDAGVSRSASID